MFTIFAYTFPRNAGAGLRCLLQAIACTIFLTLAVVGVIALVATYGALLLQLGAGLSIVALFALATQPKGGGA